RRSAVIASGYNETMGITGDPLQIALAAVCLALLGGTCVWLVAARPRGLVPVAMALTCLLATFIAWKASFVRHDDGHVRMFFAFAMVAALALWPAAAVKEGRRRWLRASCLAVIPVAVAGMQSARNEPGGDLLQTVDVLKMTVGGNIDNLMALGPYAARQQQSRQELAAELTL